MNKCILVSFLILLTIASTGTSAERMKFTVLLSVPPVFGQYEDEVKSYLKRELREIKDIKLVDKGGDFFISVVAAPIMINDSVTSIALSYVFQRESITLHNVIVRDTNSLKSMCQTVVANFDTHFLEPYRVE
jgi:hypothetical protein